MKSNVCLVIIYNHNYEENYETLQKIYSTRFSHILHLIPFTTRSEQNIIPVYGNSFFFGSYISQASQKIQNTSSDYYFFVADDVLLNPAINEDNFKHHFGVEENQAYLPYFTDLGTLQKFWLRSLDAIIWKPRKKGLEVDRFLPTYDTWLKRFVDLKISNRVSLKSILGISGQDFLILDRKLKRIEFRWKLLLLTILSQVLSLNAFAKWILRGGRPVRPLVGGYVDLFIIPKKYFGGFSNLLGVLSALELHVELAIPTSFVMQEGLRVSTDQELLVIGETQNPMKFWDELNSSFLFPSNLLYLHPVKLSKYLQV